MKNLMSSIWAIGLSASFAGCGVEPDSVTESTTSTAVTPGAWNYVINCNGIALRTCENPGACATGAHPVPERYFVASVNWSNKMAYLPDINRYALATGVDGDAYLSVNLPSSCIP